MEGYFRNGASASSTSTNRAQQARQQRDLEEARQRRARQQQSSGAVEMHALANTTIESISPQNPTAGDTVDVRVKCVMTQFDPCFGQCSSYTFWEADLLVGGQSIDFGSGLTMCEGDDAAFLEGSIQLDAGSHDVVVDGRIEDIDYSTCAIEGWESVRDKAGTIDVTAPFDSAQVAVSSCPSPSPSTVTPNESVNVEASVSNQNTQQAVADVVWTWGGQVVARQNSVTVNGGSSTTVSASFTPANQGINPSSSTSNSLQAELRNVSQA